MNERTRTNRFEATEEERENGKKPEACFVRCKNQHFTIHTNKETKTSKNHGIEQEKNTNNHMK